MAYSTQTITIDAGTAGETAFPLNFTGPGLGYIDKSEIHIYHNDVEVSFEWLTDSTINLLGVTTVEGDRILFRRIMDKDKPAVDFSDGASIEEANLDNNARHLMYMMHEVLDGYGLENIGSDMDMGGFKLTGLPDAVDPGDAMPFRQIGDSLTQAAASASSAASSASNSQAQAGVATTKAGEAATSEFNAGQSESNAADSEAAAAQAVLDCQAKVVNCQDEVVNCQAEVTNAANAAQAVIDTADVRTDLANVFTKISYYPQTAEDSGTTYEWDIINKPQVDLSLTGNVTISIKTDAPNGAFGLMKLNQNSASAYTASFDDTPKAWDWHKEEVPEVGLNQWSYVWIAVLVQGGRLACAVFMSRET